MEIMIRRATLPNYKEQVDIAIKHGIFQKIAPNINQSAEREIDAYGKFVSPSFVESHVHLDDALSAGIPRPNKSGTLQEAIRIATERKALLTTEEVKQSAEQTITWLIANGVTFIRAHTDFSPNFVKLKALLELKQTLRDVVDIQVVAFPQEGLFIQTGTDEWLEEAMKMGADVVGGLPQAEITREDGIKHIKYIFELAEKYNAPIDIHTDETGDPQSRYLEVIAKYTKTYNMYGRVTASHTTALHNYQNDYAAKVIHHVKEAGVNIVTNPFSNAILQNRLDGYPKYRGVTRVDQLLAAGVNVSIGNDNIVDPFGPLGKGNMLQAAHMLAHISHMTTDKQLNDLFAMITTNGARTLQLDGYAIEEGNRAHCIVLDAASPKEAIRLTSECLYVIFDGKIVSETIPAQRNVYLQAKEPITVNFTLE